MFKILFFYLIIFILRYFSHLSHYRKMNMHLKIVIFTLTVLETSAYPFHRSRREATWTGSKANQAHDKTDLTKDVDQIYKNHIDSSDLYNPDEHNLNPIRDEMRQKVNMESERVRTRLRQELAELQKRLSSSPTHLSSTLASMTPLTEQLQNSLSSNIQDLCGQLSRYLQALEEPETQTEARPALYQEAFDWMSQTLEHSTSKMIQIITDFNTEVTGMIKPLKEISSSEQEGTHSELWQDISSRLQQEVSSFNVEAHNRAGALKTELTALLKTAQLPKTEVTASIEQFCQNSSVQSQMFQAQLKRLFQALEELEVQKTFSLFQPSATSSIQPGGSLQEDFTAQLSTLIQDILHSV
ncbi:apolipoprotein A-IV [Antennarius striatus]|uniref:apolipoprotein A-IV n=1 Tax=Antennarius striatus TaxID=241820 RepID=UPI0035B2B772